MDSPLSIPLWGWGRGWVAAQENKEREGYRRWERKGQEVETGWPASRKEMQNLNVCHVINAFVLYFQKQGPKLLFKLDLHLVSSETSQPMSKWKFTLGLKSRLTFSEIMNPFMLAMS